MIRPDDPRHGTYAGGRAHRKQGETPCDPCHRAEARYENERQLDLLHGRPRTVPANGTLLRLRALVALGHTYPRLGEALDMTGAGAHRLTTRRRAIVRATTAAKVAALYDAWSMTLPPTGTSLERRNAAYARTVARKHRWLPPLALDDDHLDDPDYRPTKDLTEAERKDLPPWEERVDHALVEQILDGRPRPRRLTHAEADLLRRRLLARGTSTYDLEKRWGIRPDRYRAAS